MTKYNENHFLPYALQSMAALASLCELRAAYLVFEKVSYLCHVIYVLITTIEVIGILKLF